MQQVQEGGSLFDRVGALGDHHPGGACVQLGADGCGELGQVVEGQ
jgi:hypothetical protein